MVGHALWVPGMMIRSKPSVLTIEEVIQKSKSNNLKMISQAKSTGDVKLDMLAWKKTKDECDRGIAYIVKSFQELVNLFGEDVVIAVRRAIWERHGNASEWSVRVIDDFFAGLQNHASSYSNIVICIFHVHACLCEIPFLYVATFGSGQAFGDNK